MKIIKLPVYKIVVTLDGHGGGSIISDLRVEDHDSELFDAAMDGIESLILAQACVGIDIESPQYLEALETAIQVVTEDME